MKGKEPAEDTSKTFFRTKSQAREKIMVRNRRHRGSWGKE